MKQPKLKVTKYNEEIGIYDVERVAWDTTGKVRYVTVHSMIKSEFLIFFNQTNGQLIEQATELKGELIYE